MTGAGAVGAVACSGAPAAVGGLEQKGLEKGVTHYTFPCTHLAVGASNFFESAGLQRIDQIFKRAQATEKGDVGVGTSVHFIKTAPRPLDRFFKRGGGGGGAEGGVDEGMNATALGVSMGVSAGATKVGGRQRRGQGPLDSYLSAAPSARYPKDNSNKGAIGNEEEEEEVVVVEE